MVNPIEALGASAPNSGGLPTLGSAPQPTGRVQVEQQAPAASLPSDLADNVGLVFEVHGSMRDLVIKVVDRDSQRVIREIPSEEVQRLRSTMQAIVGVMFDERG